MEEGEGKMGAVPSGGAGTLRERYQEVAAPLRSRKAP